MNATASLRPTLHRVYHVIEANRGQRKSVPALAAEAVVSERTFSRATKALEQLGLLIVHRERRPGQKLNEINTYSLTTEASQNVPAPTDTLSVPPSDKMAGKESFKRQKQTTIVDVVVESLNDTTMNNQESKEPDTRRDGKETETLPPEVLAFFNPLRFSLRTAIESDIPYALRCIAAAKTKADVRDMQAYAAAAIEEGWRRLKAAQDTPPPTPSPQPEPEEETQTEYAPIVHESVQLKPFVLPEVTPPDSTLVNAWDMAYGQMQLQFDRGTWGYLADMRLAGTDASGRLIVGVRSEYARQLAQERLYRNIWHIVGDVCSVTGLLFVVMEGAR